jgi:hypothetical protein
MCHGGCDRDCNREEAISEKSKIFSTVLDACNLSYLGGRKQEDHCSKPARANSSVRPYLKKTHHRKRADGVAQGVGPEFKTQYCRKKKKLVLCLLQKSLLVPLDVQVNAG